MSYDVFSVYYDALTENVQYSAAANRICSLLTHYGIDRGLLLDLGCGTGTLSVLLAQHGYEVIGADCSPDMLMEAQSKAAEAGAQILFLCQPMEQLDLYGTIRSAVCTLDALNHLPDREAVEAALQRVSLFLEPDGIFIFDVNTLYKHREILGNKTFVYDTDKVYCVWQNTLRADNVTVDIDLDFFVPLEEDGLYEREGEHFSERAYSADTWKEMLKAAGLRILAQFDGYTENAPHEKSERVVYVVGKDSK